MAQDVMTSAEATCYLRIGIITLKRKAQRGELPAAKVGRAWRFRKTELDAWLEAGGDLPEELVDWALVELARQRQAEAAVSGEKPIPLAQVLEEYGV